MWCAGLTVCGVQGLVDCLFDIWDKDRAGQLDRRQLYAGLVLMAHAEYEAYLAVCSCWLTTCL